ncbi:MAG TPA: AzlD domain-containing protein [Chloroflexi bacterium]|nr:AzlD domain-containing protein [Chloroflexota bacterium]
MNEVLLIGGMAAVTFAARYPVLALLGRLKLPDPLFRALRYVPPAVLVAITVPAVLMPDGGLSLSYTNAYLIGGLVAAAVSWRSKNLLLTIIISMAAFLGWRALVGG